jgi:hypothetical protein
MYSYVKNDTTCTLCYVHAVSLHNTGNFGIAVNFVRFFAKISRKFCEIESILSGYNIHN